MKSCRPLNHHVGSQRGTIVAPTRRHSQRIHVTARDNPFINDAIGRRLLLSGMFLMTSVYPAVGQEQEEEQIPTKTPTKTVPVKPKLFIARDFLFAYPRGWTIVEDTENSTSDRRRQNVVRGEVMSPDGIVTVSVIQQQASKLKQSLFQITDVSQLGSVEEVSKLVLPPGSRIDAASVRTFPIPPKDTGTVMGVIERDPVVVYRYSARLRNGVRSEIAVGIILGRVLILGAGCTEDNWEKNEPICKAIADSFKLLPKQA